MRDSRNWFGPTLEVRVGLRINLDLQLEVGDVQQTVSVEAVAPTPGLQARTRTRGGRISPQLMNTLPLFNGSLHNARAFVDYIPGVISARSEHRQFQRPRQGVEIGGSLRFRNRGVSAKLSRI
jgi:hypothetical protein